MNMSDIARLLRRPVAAAALVSRAAPPRSKQGRVPAPAAEELPATAAELETALAACWAERQAAEQTLATAAERRERLMLDDDHWDDEAIRDLDREADLAAIRIERLDRIEPRLVAKLREVKAIERAARFDVAKMRLVQAGERIAPLFRAAAEAQAAYLEVRDQVLSEFRDANDRLPGFFSLQLQDVDQFENELAALRALKMHVHPPKLNTSVAELVARAVETGDYDHASPFAAQIDQALAKNVWVITKKSITDAQGTPVKNGTEIQLTYEDALRLVRRGDAIFKE